MNADSATLMRDSEKPQQIIDAAIRVFARHGYYNSRVYRLRDTAPSVADIFLKGVQG
jgi:AcrR family transcriptional regulator